MKSIMEEASSVIKAIEKGWVQAGKPQEFTIKVFEEATKNFLGITTKPAKIAIFFQESFTKSTEPSAHALGNQTERQRRTPHEKQPAFTKHGEKRAERNPRHAATGQEKNPTFTKTSSDMSASKQTGEPKTKNIEKETWTPEMVTAAQGWMQGILRSLDKQQLHFSTDVKNYYLKISITTPVFDDADKEKALFRNCAYLIMQSLRNKFKKSFRGFKVILSSSR
ncbi:MAG: Jag N-terminal domain-containing protein [Candidatus Babeliales bacterium]